MKIALIPPRGLENYALGSRFHLALAIPELIRRATYRGMYERATRLGDYVVLDNGAYEGQTVPDGLLFATSERLMCSEIVLPDVMLNTTDTVSRVAEYCRSYNSSVKKMAVAQGTTQEQFRRCVEAFSQRPEIQVLGIPKHMPTTLEKPAARIEFANWVKTRYKERFEIHFLGANSMWLGEIRAVTKYANHVRSLDTSLPFNYAIAGAELKVMSSTGTVISRPDHYFDADWSREITTSLIQDNIATIMEWARAEFRQETPASGV